MSTLKPGSAATPDRSGGYSLFAYGFLALFVLTVLGALWYSVVRERAALLAIQEQRARANVLVFEDQISQTLQLIENTLRTLPEVSDTALDRSRPEDLQRLLARLQFSQPAVRSMSVLDATGAVRASSSPANVGQRVALDSFYPLEPADAPSAVLRVGPVWQGRDLADGRATSPLQPGGWDQPSFIPLVLRVGVNAQAVWLLAALNPDYLLGRHARYRQSDTDQFELVRLDGSVLVSTEEQPLGAAFGAAGLLKRVLQEETGIERADAQVQRLTAFRNSARYPFFVTVHIDEAQALRGWLRKTRTLVLLVVLALTAVVGVTLALMWRIRKNEAAKLAHRRTIRTLSQAIEQSPGGVVILDTQGVIQYCNPFFCQLSGFAEQQLLGHKPDLLVDAALPAVDFAHMTAELNAGRNVSAEFQLRHPQGHVYTVFSVMAPLRDEQGNITHHVSVSHDISAQKQMQRALVLERDRAEAATVAKSEFLANMSHEVRTPMNGVLGLTELALETDLDDMQRDYLTAVQQSARSLMELLSDILDFSRIEAGKLQADAVAFDLTQLLGDVLGSYAERAGRKGVHLVSRLAPDLPREVLGDAPHLRQVLENLLDNALKFTEFGSVSLEGSARPLADGGFEASLCVRDTGIGIAPAQQDLVFEAFSQADNSSTRRYGGTGLGLAICSRLVELMGGRIWVESEEGRGTAFHFTLRLGVVHAVMPVPPTVAAAVEAAADAAAHGPLGKLAAPLGGVMPTLRVLVVEDNKVNQMLANTVLTKWGHMVELAENGQEAVEKYAQGPWDLVLMDLQMPVMGGLEAAARIRAMEAPGVRTPIVAVTANVQDKDRAACLAAGMDDFLPKPMQRQVLQQMLVKYCGAITP